MWREKAPFHTVHISLDLFQTLHKFVTLNYPSMAENKHQISAITNVTEISYTICMRKIKCKLAQIASSRLIITSRVQNSKIIHEIILMNNSCLHPAPLSLKEYTSHTNYIQQETSPALLLRLIMITTSHKTILKHTLSIYYKSTYGQKKP